MPDQLSLIGFDDVQAAALVTPPLTTIRQPMADIGAWATRLLDQLVNGKPVAQQAHRAAPEVVVRSSSAPAPGEYSPGRDARTGKLVVAPAGHLSRRRETMKRKKQRLSTGWFRGFTLIELLVVIAIIAILRQSCFRCSPKLGKQRERRAALVTCASSGWVSKCATQDYDGKYPFWNWGSNGQGGGNMVSLLACRDLPFH